MVDLLDGRTFDSYEPALAHAKQVDGDAQEAEALERSRVVEGPFVAVGFSAGGGLAEYVATQRPDDARGVVVMGSAMPTKYLGDGSASWPSGVPVQEHVGDHDDFDDGPEVRADFTADVEQAGVTPESSPPTPTPATSSTSPACPPSTTPRRPRSSTPACSPSWPTDAPPRGLDRGVNWSAARPCGRLTP